VDVNIEETELSDFADVSLRGSASAILAELVKEIEEHRKIDESK